MAENVEITFRPATTGDIPIIRELAGRIWREHYPGIITHGQIDYMLGKMYAEAVIADEIASQGYRYVLVLIGLEPVGFIAYVHEAVNRAVKISKLYLLPSLHGKGIGRLMLGQATDYAKLMGARSVYLFVNKNNTKAILAYERFGFVKAAEVVTDIGNGYVMDDYRMELPL
jgi:ribosomal protein S18 acetylase RimI-like enzyme